MKKRLKGLISIWLSVVMLMSMAASPLSVSASTSSIQIAVNLTDSFPQAGADAFPDDISVTSGATLASAIPNTVIPAVCEIVGWQIWRCEGFLGGCGYYYYVEKTADKPADWIPTEQEAADYEFSGDTGYVATPIIKANVMLFTDLSDSPYGGYPLTENSNYKYIDVILNIPFDNPAQTDMAAYIDGLPDNKYVNSYSIYSANSAETLGRRQDGAQGLSLSLARSIFGEVGATPLIVPRYSVAEVYVGGVKLDFETYYKNNDKSVTSDGSASDYNAYLDKMDGKYVLTIKNLDVEGNDSGFVSWLDIVGSGGFFPYPESAGIASNVDLTIDVQGDNIVKGVENTVAGDVNPTVGVAAYGALVLTGGGKLTANTDAATRQGGCTAGITAQYITATGPHLDVTVGSAAADSFGAYAYNDFTITGGALESEILSDGSAYAIYCNNLYFSDAAQSDGNWYKWKTSKDGDWSISSDGNQYFPLNDGTENYVFIAPVSYTESVPDTDLGLPGDIIIMPPNIPSGGGGAVKYSVKFESNGGTEIKTQYISKAAKVTKPDDPTREGFEFGGWYADEELTNEYDFTSRISKNITLYAKWNEITQTPDVPEADSSAAIEPKNPFADVDENDWFFDAVEYMYQNGYMTGTSDDRFDPDMSITRAMFVTILYRIENKPDIAMSALFKDVSSGSYYKDAVAWAYSTGIVNGVSDTQFSPDLIITREQMAAMMYRYANYKKYDTSVGDNTNILSYDDFDKISEYAIPAMQYAVGAGIIRGENVSTLNPLGLATRAATAVIIHRFIEANN